MATRATTPRETQEKRNTNVTRLETRVEAAWMDYVAACVRVERTMMLEDGVAAGRAWARFLREFSRMEGELP